MRRYHDGADFAPPPDELPLFQQPVLPLPRARASDPATSHAAADSMTHAAGMQRALILNALKAHGPMTADELDALLGLRPSTSGRRLIELVRDGTVAITDETRPTRSGREAQVYRKAAA